MTNLLNVENLTIAYGLQPILDQVKFQISKGERVCLIGRNGTGKSTFLKLIEGNLLPDSGNVIRKQGLKISRLQQELNVSENITVFEFVANGLDELGKLLADYHRLSHSLTQDATPKLLIQLQELQHQIEIKNAWSLENTINKILTRLNLDPDIAVNELSGGWQKRAALAKALVAAPDLLLLDEPTNHLDIEGIQWLEDQLLNSNLTLLFITHDRALLKKLATRIIELDRGNLTSWPGDYDNFLRRKEEALHAEEKQNALFDKKLAEEERWIRQGIKARRTRNEGRVRALEQLRYERAQRRNLQGNAAFEIEVKQSGKQVIEAKHISFAYHNKLIIHDFSTQIMRGDKIGLIGPNGCGKTTLLNLLLGYLQPQQGSVTLGTQLQIRYFDQLREKLDYEKNVMENVVEGTDTIEINGKKKHIIQYLKDFLFTPERAFTPIKSLSGGECNRLLLAKLFSQSANLLVMDEPTNDLDIETLELLEELLIEYKGTLILVSHDRAFLDNVVTSTMVLEGNGKVQEYVGGYADWLKQQKEKNRVAEKSKATQPVIKKEKTKSKLSNKHQQTLTAITKEIETLETEQTELENMISTADFYQNDPAFVATKLQRLNELINKIQLLYDKWSELELKNNDNQE